MKKFNLHLVSDSTGETVGSVARAAIVQFDDVEPEEFNWTLVRTEAQIEKVIEGIRAIPVLTRYDCTRLSEATPVPLPDLVGAAAPNGCAHNHRLAF